MYVIQKKTRMRIWMKYLVLPAFIIFTVFYIGVDSLNMPVMIKFIDPKLKYILIWSKSYYPAISSLAKGQDIFLKLKCPVNNCYVTEDKLFMNKSTDFDVVLFHGPDLQTIPHGFLPRHRASHQQYVYVSMESSQYYPITYKKYDDFFNWTWTFKLNSDLYFGYIIIRNKEGHIIGPQHKMSWLDIEEMEPINDTLKAELNQKKLAAAWIVSNCETPSKRELLAFDLQYELKKYNMTLDVYGKCGRKSCPRNGTNNCNLLIKNWYYFYLSFENSFSEDYVTEKLLTALLNNAVPIVYGGADYSRFMPDGAYLDALQLGVEKLAQRMFEAINDNETYYEFFKWRNHYSYHDALESIETNYYCKFCSKVNEKMEEVANNESSLDYHKYFRHWWNSPLPEKLVEDEALATFV